MAATKHASLTSHVSDDDLFAALTYVVQQGDYDIGGLSNEQKVLLFSSSRSMMSFGNVFAATVKAEGSGSVLQLTVATPPGAPRSLMDGRRNQKAATKLIEAVDSVLAAPTPPRPEPVASFAKKKDGSTVPWTHGEYPGD